MIKINKKKYFLIGIIATILFVLSIIIYVIMPRGKPVIFSPIEIDFFLEVINDGDIICRLGDRSWSRHFSNVSINDKRFSHMGILRINDGLVTVIHAEGDTSRVNDYVKEETLEDFIKHARAVGIYRINDIDTNQISSFAVEYIDIPFDWQFDMQDDTKLYCTELLYVILKRIAPEIELKTVFFKILDRYIIPLEAISNSQYFMEIYYIASTL